MALWLIFALMTAAAIFAVLWPLSRSRTGSGGSDLEVYRDQIEEIDRDLAAGLIGSAEAEAARIEVSRRLIAAADTAEAAPRAGKHDTSLGSRRAAAAAAVVILPLIATATYLALGSPHLPGEPLAARRLPADASQPLAGLVSQVEAHLAQNPNDGRGWELLAPVYLRLGRFEDAVKARRSAMALNGETADRQTELGEALTIAANGSVTLEALKAFERAVALDGRQFKARFYIGQGQLQDGRKDEAAAIWRALIAEAPPDAPWLPTVREALARSGTADARASGETTVTPGPSAEDVAAAAGLSAADRRDMIEGMVSRLAARLAQDGSDIDGWLRLMRAYMVMGARDKASAAAADARKALAGDADRLRRIDELAEQLGIKG